MAFRDGAIDLDLSPSLKGGLALTRIVADTAIPLYFSWSGDLVLHGALLEQEGKAVACLGQSFVGKSTLALEWAAAGGRYLADDWFRVTWNGDSPQGWPSYGTIKLRASGVGGREEGRVGRGRRMEDGRTWFVSEPDSPGYCRTPLPLARILVLGRRIETSGSLARSRLRGTAAVMELLKSLRALPEFGLQSWSASLRSAARLEQALGVERVSYPSGPDGMALLMSELRELPLTEREEMGTGALSP